MAPNYGKNVEHDGATDPRQVLLLGRQISLTKPRQPNTNPAATGKNEGYRTKVFTPVHMATTPSSHEVRVISSVSQKVGTGK